MGDAIEICTGQKYHHMFYKVTSSAVSFEIKATSDAAIGLAKKPSGKCNYWIAIGYDNKCRIKKQNTEGCIKADTPNILSSNEYRRFWLTWDADCLRLGRFGDTNPIVTYVDRQVHKCNYITFFPINERIPVFWKLELPPIFNNLQSLKPMSSGKPTWIAADTQLPDDAFIGGYEKENLYVIRASHRQSLTPGKFVPSEGVGYISWGGEANEKNTFEVLCGYNCIWVSTSEDNIPVGAIEAGYTEQVVREKLYVGRVYINGYLIPGKVQPSHKVCYIPYEGREIASKKYEILIEPHKNAHSANTNFISPIDFDLSDEHEYDQIDEDNSDFEDD